MFARTRKKPDYNFLPTYNCVDYEYLSARKLLIHRDDLFVLDNGVRFIDTLFSGSDVFYQIQDTLMVSTNPDHYNIEVDFLVKDPNHPKADKQGYYEFDWRKTFCQSFDGRFPELVEKDGVPLEGTLKYTMVSSGFGTLFNIQTLKLRVQVKDRLLHRSNVIETREFTLDQIRK